MSDQNKKRVITHDWRPLFTPEQVEEAARLVKKEQYSHFHYTQLQAEAKIYAADEVHTVYITSCPRSYSTSWNTNTLKCSCQRTSRPRKKRFGSYWDVISAFEPCVHLAALLTLWESRRGPWTFEETPEEKKQREFRDEKERKEKEEQRRIAAELAERQRKKEQLKSEKLSAADLLREFFPLRDDRFFDLEAAAEKITIDGYTAFLARRFYGTPGTGMTGNRLINSSGREQALEITGTVRDPAQPNRNAAVGIVLLQNKLDKFHCSICNPWGYSVNGPCPHELTALIFAAKYLSENNPGDATDTSALLFMEAFAKAPASEEGNASDTLRKTANVRLFPMIHIEDDRPVLGFKISGGGGKQYMLKQLKELAAAYEEEGVLPLGKNAEIDFSAQDFTENSIPWVRMVMQKISDNQQTNQQLHRRNSWYDASIKLKNKDVLTGSTLDRFYELAQGSSCDFQNRSAGKSGTLRIGHKAMEVSITASPLKNHKGRVIGVEVTGTMPRLLQGSTECYILDDTALSRLSREETRALLPFRTASDAAGNILFRIGEKELPEFCYRILPELSSNPCVDFTDNFSEVISTILPPEAKFTFRMDIEAGHFTCRPEIAYDDRVLHPLKDMKDQQEPDSVTLLWRREEPKKTEAAALQTAYGRMMNESPSDDRNGDNIEVARARLDFNSRLPGDITSGEYRDIPQERRVISALQRIFPEYDAANACYQLDYTDENGFKLLQEGVPELNRFGMVLGTEEFRKLKLRSTTRLGVRVSIDSGLMDLSVTSKDLTSEELLEVLYSYKRRKRYHRLRSGDYIAFSQDEQLSSLLSLAQDMDLSLEELAEKGAKIPAYRALYLDKLLSDRESLHADRNRNFRNLIKNFQTIRDADYEVPESMQDTLRSYQAYGYKWLRTLQAAGFGGILADEMGLGKTIQAIALFQSWHEEGLTAPVLVVCPASLVYNWQEEVRRFAPGLRVVTLTGNVAARKKLSEELSPFDPAVSPEVCIISYDLLRRDLELYRSMTFHAMFLDEAQYIKNQKAANTKSVKLINARYRFALTGTPIENRLAELWSIFDFLMPGFLYSYDDFAARFEAPIVKEKDEEAAGRLKQMVRPFILRRLKQDVLKDLPEKLEEVRYARLEDTQRQIYDGQVTHMIELLENASGPEDKFKVLGEMTRLREICCDPSLIFENYQGSSAKREACLDLIESAIEGGHRMLVFSAFVNMLKLLEEDLKKRKIAFYEIIGTTPKEERMRLVHKFNDGDTPVFLISLKAGGTGLNLTGADVVIHYDPWWNLAAQNQATDRAHRIGQEKTVTVYRMIARDTVEEKILALQEAKKDLADAILSGEASSLHSLSTEELLELLRND